MWVFIRLFGGYVEVRQVGEEKRVLSFVVLDKNNMAGGQDQKICHA